MRPLVSLHVVLLDELHAALIASERLLSAVDLLVSLQQVFLDEAHTALAALEGSLSGVNEDVPPQVVGASESSTAVVADVRFLTWGEDGAFSVSDQRRFGRCAWLPLGFDSLRFWLWPLCLFDGSVLLWLLAAAAAAAAASPRSLPSPGWPGARSRWGRSRQGDPARAEPRGRLPLGPSGRGRLRPRGVPGAGDARQPPPLRSQLPGGPGDARGKSGLSFLLLLLLLFYRHTYSFSLRLAFGKSP